MPAETETNFVFKNNLKKYWTGASISIELKANVCVYTQPENDEEKNFVK